MDVIDLFIDCLTCDVTTYLNVRPVVFRTLNLIFTTGDGRQSGYEWPEPVSLVSGSRRPSQQPQAARRNSNRSTPIQTPTHYSDTLIDGSTNSSLSLGIAPQPSERNLGPSARRPTPTASYDPGTKPQPLTEKPQHSEDDDPRYMEEQKHFPYENN